MAALNKCLGFWVLSKLADSTRSMDRSLLLSSWNGRRRMSTIKSEAVVYDEHGDPCEVLRLDKINTQTMDSNSIRVQMVAAPINPADINQIQGVYAIRPTLPAVGGNEGFGRVLEVGSDVTQFVPGDQVVLAEAGLGTWNTQLVLSEHQLIKIPSDLSMEFAATVGVNPCTAYRMLKDFEELKPGDTVIQNGANSGVGQAIIQLAAAWGIRTVNIIRDRPELDDVRRHLNTLGADCVVTEEFSRGSEMRDLIFKDFKKPMLALNCVGGKSSMDLLRFLSPRGTMVTYGGMSKKPVTVPTSALIFKDLRVRGFWLTKWNQSNKKSPERLSMLDDLCQMARMDVLCAPRCNIYPLKDFNTAVSGSMKPFTTYKNLLLLN